MSITRRMSLVLVLSLITWFGSACTAVVKPHISQSEFLSRETQIPGIVHLYVSESFQITASRRQTYLTSRSGSSRSAKLRPMPSITGSKVASQSAVSNSGLRVSRSTQLRQISSPL